MSTSPLPRAADAPYALDVLRCLINAREQELAALYAAAAALDKPRVPRPAAVAPVPREVRRERPSSARRAVLLALAGGVKTCPELVAETGMGNASVRAAVARLLEDGEIANAGAARRADAKPGRAPQSYALAESLELDVTPDGDEAEPARTSSSPHPPRIARSETAQAQAAQERHSRLRDEVLRYLQRHGPKTSRQVAQDLTRNGAEVGMALTHLERRGAVVRAGVLGFNAVATP